MNCHIIEIEGREYRCKITTKALVVLESKLGVNPVMLFAQEGVIPKLTDLMFVFHASLQAYEHGISLNDAYDLYDKYIEEGHSLNDFIPELVKIMQVSGLIALKGEEKN